MYRIIKYKKSQKYPFRFTQPNDGVGNIFSLGLLTNINRKEASDNARRYIGQGCCIYAEKDTENVYLQNQSGSSIFVQVFLDLKNVTQNLKHF